MESAQKEQIKHQIEKTKEQINETVQEIQEKFQGVTLKNQVEDHPFRTLFISVGVGVILSGTGKMLFHRVGQTVGNALLTAASASIVGFLVKPQLEHDHA